MAMGRLVHNVKRILWIGGEGGCGVTENEAKIVLDELGWNGIVSEAQAHIKTKDKMAELKKELDITKEQRDIYRKNWQEAKDLKFAIEGHSGWLFKQNEELKQAGNEMEKRLCQIIFSADFTDNESVDVVNTWRKVKEGVE